VDLADKQGAALLAVRAAMTLARLMPGDPGTRRLLAGLRAAVAGCRRLSAGPQVTRSAKSRNLLDFRSPDTTTFADAAGVEPRSIASTDRTGSGAR
jgi:hypothetical protein